MKNLFLSSLKVIRPKEYGGIVLALMSVAFVSSSKASFPFQDLFIHEAAFEDIQNGTSFSLLPSVSRSLAGSSQDSLPSFDVGIFQRQKRSSLFHTSNSLCQYQCVPRVCTRAYYSCTLGNFDRIKRANT